MATAAYQGPDTATRLSVPSDDRHGWGFALLLAVVATLCLRPADLIPALDDWPVYQYLIVGCLLVSSRATLRQLAQHRLAEQPVTACLLVLLLAVGVSHLAHGFFWGARMSMYDVSKLLALYLLIVGLVNTPRRLTQFVQWLTLSITTIAALALLDRVGIISIAALESVESHDASEAGQAIYVERIRGTGIFQDPNDFGLILVTGLVLGASSLFRPHAGLIALPVADSGIGVANHARDDAFTRCVACIGLCVPRRSGVRSQLAACRIVNGGSAVVGDRVL